MKRNANWAENFFTGKEIITDFRLNYYHLEEPLRKNKKFKRSAALTFGYAKNEENNENSKRKHSNFDIKNKRFKSTELNQFKIRFKLPKTSLALLTRPGEEIITIKEAIKLMQN
ncbi:unnamed protein product [Blepharisma stoltei]|uniref:Uncharacterized protein n=1 Tax=Blepharisma stoltei TaxID=1481888 RepID=A0AAU9JEH7_9CILI|nr:unnamed protein product [Blepharisma stoltei]